MSADIIITRRSASVTNVCAYCGGRAKFELRYENLCGFCCDEPTHWVWLMESIKTVAKLP